MCFDGLERGQLDRGARGDVEARPMPWALDLVALELALVERTAIMRAQVVDRVQLAIDVAHRDIMVAHAEDRHALGLNIGGAGHRLPGRHRRDHADVMADQTTCSTLGSWSLESVDWKNPSTINCSAVARSRPRLCK